MTRDPEPEPDNDDKTTEDDEKVRESGGLPAPFAPDGDDDSAFGDTDQHSDA